MILFLVPFFLPKNEKSKANEMKKMFIIKIWRLKSVAGQLSDRPKIFAGQNENLLGPVVQS